MLFNVRNVKEMVFLGAIIAALLCCCNSCGSSVMTTNVTKGASVDYIIAGTVWVDMDDDEVFEPEEDDFVAGNCPFVTWDGADDYSDVKYTDTSGMYSVTITEDTNLIFYLYPNPTNQLAYMATEQGVGVSYGNDRYGQYAAVVGVFTSGENHSANLRFYADWP